MRAPAHQARPGRRCPQERRTHPAEGTARGVKKRIAGGRGVVRQAGLPPTRSRPCRRTSRPRSSLPVAGEGRVTNATKGFTRFTGVAHSLKFYRIS